MKRLYPYLCLMLLFVSGLLTGCRQTTKQENIYQYANYSTVDWERIKTAYYRPYTADWSDEIEQRIHPDFPMEIAAEFWHNLQNAKTDFHQLSLPIRAASSLAVYEAFDRAEAMFDTVFVRCVEQEYYLRLFVDEYNDIMPTAIDDLCRTMAAENTIRISRF